MAQKTKTIALTRELHEIIIVRPGKSFRSFCDPCRSEVEFLSLDDAIHFSGLGTREMLLRVERFELHAREMTSGHLLICLNSLAKKH